jgi:hypothetical protein
VWVHEEVAIDLRSTPLKNKNKIKNPVEINRKKEKRGSKGGKKKGACDAEEGFYSVFFSQS